MPKKSNFIQPEFTLAEFGIQLMLCKFLKYQTQMSFMLFFGLGVDQNVIDENDNELVKELHEHLVHHIHEISWCIGQTKWHHGILIQSIPSGESCLRYVLFSYLELEIT